MLVATNHQFAIPLIPECRLSGLQQWAEENRLLITNKPQDNLHYFVPYRNSYDRIIRGLAADWHELMITNRVANLNSTRWSDIGHIALSYINKWIEHPSSSVPIDKHNRHTAYFISYITKDLLTSGTFFDISAIDQLPIRLNSQFNLNLSQTIPDHSESFYDHTVPYWVVDELYHQNPKLKQMIDQYCSNDTQITVTNLL